MAIFRRPASFVIGSHKNHGREFRKAGLAFDVIKLRGLTVERLRRIIEKRINWARRRDDKPVPSISEATCAKLIAKFGDDIRAIEYYLYDVFQNLREVNDV